MSSFERTDLVDIHSHLVPSVDDGAKSLVESLRHLRQLASEGVARLSVSPHLNGTLVAEPGALAARLSELRRGYDRLVAACDGTNDVPSLGFGQELLAPSAAVVRRALRVADVGIAGTDYVLLELGFWLEGPDAGEAVRAACESGRRPIIAHPERYHRGDSLLPLDEIRAWKEAGALLQVNGGSLLGNYGDAIRDQAWRLVGEGLADVLATDHHADYRPISPAEVGRLLAARGAADQATLLLATNPGRILDDRPVEAVPPHAEQAAA